MIEERKEYLEKLSIHREAEEQRRAEQQLREQQRLVWKENVSKIWPSFILIYNSNNFSVVNESYLGAQPLSSDEDCTIVINDKTSSSLNFDLNFSNSFQQAESEDYDVSPSRQISYQQRKQTMLKSRKLSNKQVAKLLERQAFSFLLELIGKKSFKVCHMPFYELNSIISCGRGWIVTV